MSFYLDTSVVVPLFKKEARSDVIDQWFRAVELPLFMPDLTVAEVSATMSKFVRVYEMTVEQREATWERFARWRDEVTDPVENLPTDIRQAAGLVRDPFPKLLAADAIHLATCRRLGLTLVADDKDMIEIADRLGVPTLNPR